MKTQALARYATRDLFTADVKTDDEIRAELAAFAALGIVPPTNDDDDDISDLL